MDEVVLVVKHETLKCSRKTLSTASPYFHAMFYSGFAESSSKTIQINDVEPEVMRFLIDYACTGELITPAFDYLKVLEASCLFQFAEICDFTIKILINKLDRDNCLYIWQASDLLSLKRLTKLAKSIALWDLFSQSIANQDFNKLKYKYFFELISDCNLRVTEEFYIFEAIVKWSESNSPTNSELKDLVKCICFKQLSNEQKKEVIKYSDLKVLFGINDLITKHLIPIKDGEVNNDVSNENIMTARFLPLCPIIVVTKITESIPKIVLYTCKELEMNVEVKVLFKFNLERLEHSPRCLVGFGIAVTGKDVYFFGGKENIATGTWNEQLWKYDSFKDSWKALSPMPKKNRHFQTASNDQYIFLIGGFGLYRVAHTSGIYYSIEHDIWMELPETPCPVYCAAIVVYDDFLYLFSNAVYRFKPTEGIWERVAIEAPLLGCTYAAVYGNDIYLFSSIKRSIAVYDPHANKLLRLISLGEKQWDYCCILHQRVWLFYDKGVEVLDLSEPSKSIWKPVVPETKIEYVSVITFYDI